MLSSSNSVLNYLDAIPFSSQSSSLGTEDRLWLTLELYLDGRKERRKLDLFLVPHDFSPSALSTPSSILVYFVFRSSNAAAIFTSWVYRS